MRPRLRLECTLFDRTVGELKIPPELTIICGLAVGCPDPGFPANKLRIGRDPVENNVVFLDH